MILQAPCGLVSDTRMGTEQCRSFSLHRLPAQAPLLHVYQEPEGQPAWLIRTPGSVRVSLKRTKRRGWRDAHGSRALVCSSRGHKFSAGHPHHWLRTICDCCSRGPNILFWTLRALIFTGTFPEHAHIQGIFFFLKKKTF